MHNSNLLKLLSKLDKAEWKQFNKFIQSPYFNTNKSLILFLELLKKHYPNFASAKLEKKAVYRKLFPTTSYKEKRIWQLMSDLKGLFERFLVIEKIDKSSITYQMQLKDCYLEKEMYEWFQQKSKTLEDTLVNVNNIDAHDQLYLHQIHDHLYFNTFSDKSIIEHPNLLAASTHLEQYYYLQQLRYACEWITRSFRLKEKMPSFLEEINFQNQYQENPLYTLYYEIYLLFQSNSEITPQFYTSLIDKLKINIDKFSKKDQISLIIYLINYGVRRMHLNNETYSPIILDLYKLGLKEQRLIYKGHLPNTTFMNIVNMACKLADFKWLESFLKNYQPYFIKLSEVANTGYAKTNIAYYKKNYQEAVRLSDTYYFGHKLMELTRRSIQIRACFECFLVENNYFDLLMNKSLSFEKYMNRKEVYQITKKNIYYNLNKSIRQLTKLIHKKQPVEKLENLKKEIEATSELGAKNWLLSHVEEQIKSGHEKKNILTS